MPTTFTVGPGVKALRAERLWSQEKLARQLEMSKQTIWATEADRTSPNLQTLQLMADAFELTVPAFIERCEKEWAARDLNPEPWD